MNVCICLCFLTTFSLICYCEFLFHSLVCDTMDTVVSSTAEVTDGVGTIKLLEKTVISEAAKDGNVGTPKTSCEFTITTCK